MILQEQLFSISLLFGGTFFFSIFFFFMQVSPDQSSHLTLKLWVLQIFPG